MKPFNVPWSGISNKILGISVDQGASKLPDATLMAQNNCSAEPST